MSFARVDAGQIEHGLAPVRIADLVARVARGAPDADVEVVADDVLRAHPALLEAALANLVRNANQHGGGARRIAYEVDGATGRLIVDDDGPGLPAQSRLFQRFARGAEPREVGLGLGLALTREIARRHGGECTLEERPGGGCRAELTLPRVAALQDTDPRSDRAAR
jgi:signal transduction histidine kinase